MKKIIALILIVAMMLCVGCSNEPASDTPTETPQELTKVTVSLDWTPNTNHTGLYVAKDNGYYEAAGLDVEIIQPAGGTAEQLVATNQVQFGVSYQEAVTYARIEGMPVKSIAAIIQHNTSGFASLKSKGIETAADFEGMSYGGWGSPVEKATLKALMDDVGADVEKVDILTTGSSDFFASSESEVDFAWIFEGWTGVEASLKGIELNYIDLGKENAALDYYTPVIVTSEKMIVEETDAVAAFMEATKKGYEFAISSPEEAAQVLLSNAPELDEELVVASQLFLQDKYQGDADMWGVQKTAVWDNYTNWLFDRELITDKIEANDAFTNDFIK